MTRQELIRQLQGLNVSRRGNRSALYKPLLLLLLLSRTRRSGVQHVAFSDIESDLRALIERYSPEDSAESVGQPWWHLPTDGLWRVRDAQGVTIREPGTPRGDQRVPGLEQLRSQTGEFPRALQELFENDPEAVLASMDFLLEQFFGDQAPSPRGELLARTVDASPTSQLASSRVLAGRIGRPYANAGRLPPSTRRDPFDIDPDVVDRANQAHASTLDALSDYLRAQGIEPRCPESDDPPFDLAWLRDQMVFVAEVKSVTDTNEERQLRLGLGQVLRYRQAFETRGFAVVAVLVPERKPNGTGWTTLCRGLGVLLVWPGDFDSLLAR